MPRVFKSELRIVLAPSGIALLRTHGWLRPHTELLAECELGTAESAAARLDELLNTEACKAQPARIVLADHWARHWMVTPPANAARLVDCEVAAQARFQALYGEPLGEWQMSADWQARAPFLASALPRALLAALIEVCDKHELLLLEIAPQFVASWNRWRSGLRSGHWFGVLQDQWLTLGLSTGRRLAELRSLQVPAEALADPHWLRLTVEREAMRLMQAAPRGVQLCGGVPAAWLRGASEDWTCSQIEAPGEPDEPGEPSPSSGSGPLRLAAAVGWQ